MSEKYLKFIKSIDIISEEKFNEILELLPEFDLDSVDYMYVYDFSDKYEIARVFINTILQKWNDVFLEDLDFKRKELILWDVEKLEDLEEIKNTFIHWNINYEELKAEILERKKDLEEKRLRYKKENF